MISRAKSVALARLDETNATKSTIGKPEKALGIPDNSAGSPTPYQFEKFIPWVCTQWCASTAVLVTKMVQEKYVAKHEARRMTRTRKSIKAVNVPHPVVPVMSDDESTEKHSSSSEAIAALVKRDKIVPISAYYDDKQNLVEIAIFGSQVIVSRKVIHALSLCIPYYPLLNRFTFRKGGLTGALIYEVNKLIPISNITELCFDNSYVKQNNYYIFLEQFSQLKYLSLNQCRIDDDACHKIFVNLDFEAPSSNSLQILDLGSNEITDVGAKFIGSVLKMNRCLLHLNLSGNKITDEGFKYILDSLMEFPLSQEENMAAKRRRLRFLYDKVVVYQRCLYELKYGQSEDMVSSSSSRKSISVRKLRRKSRKTITGTNETNLGDIADMMAKRILGEFIDPYAPQHTVRKHDVIYAKGNFILCSLNIAYNDLSYSSVQKLAEVLAYQGDLDKSSANETGLVRVTLDGNYIPATCNELDEIDENLRRVVVSRLPLVRKTRTSSLLRKMFPQKQNTTTFSNT